MRITILALALLAATTVCAQDQTYTFSFQGASDTLFPTQASIDYNLAPGALNPFNLFSITWDGHLFDFTQVANQFNYFPGSFAPLYFDTTNAGCDPGIVGMQPEIVILTRCTSNARWAARSIAGASIGFSLFYQPVYFADGEPSDGQASAEAGYDNGGGGLPFTVNMTPLNSPSGDPSGEFRYKGDGCVCK
jgi:hypothetical protein